MLDVPAGPPATLLTPHLSDVTANSSAVAVVKDSDLKMCHVKQFFEEEQPIGQACLLVKFRCSLNHLSCTLWKRWDNKMCQGTSNNPQRQSQKM